jgi:hypothetical protein
MNVAEMAKVMMDWKLNTDSFETFARDLDALITTMTKKFPHATSDEIQHALRSLYRNGRHSPSSREWSQSTLQRSTTIRFDYSGRH